MSRFSLQSAAVLAVVQSVCLAETALADHRDRIDAPEGLFDCIAILNQARHELALTIARFDDDGFAIAGLSTQRCVRMVTRSAHPSALWQLTRFDVANQPFSDSEYDDKYEAVKAFLQEVETASLIDHDMWDRDRIAA